MPGGFYGSSSVIASKQKHLATGKVITSAVLKVRSTADTFTSVPYANAYVYPIREQSTYGGDGAASQQTTIVLWQIGESSAPSTDDQIVANSQTWLILAVDSRLAADTGYAVHDCTVARTP